MNTTADATPQPILQTRGLTKDYHSVMRLDAPLKDRLANLAFGWLGYGRSSERLWEPRRILTDIELSIPDGEITAITGRSGAGKSTLLHLLGAFDQPTSGQVLYRGEDIFARSEQQLSDFRNQHIGFVFQFYHLFQDLDAFENVLLPALIGPSFHGARRAALHDRARELVEAVGLSHRTRHRPNQLSGGEQQRIAIARALLHEPSILLCDEPTGNLDSDTGKRILELLFKLQDQEKRSYVIVTHDEDVAALADHHVVVRAGLLAS
jgi:lipoprotein-releasing system ATP-binding protein